MQTEFLHTFRNILIHIVLEKQFDSQKHPFENGSSFQANDIRSSIDNCFYKYTIQQDARCTKTFG